MSQSVMCKESSDMNSRDKQTNEQGTHESSVGVLVRVHMLHVCVHVNKVVVVVVLRILVIIAVIFNVSKN